MEPMIPSYDFALGSQGLSIAVEGCKLCQGCTIFLKHKEKGGKESGAREESQ